MNSTRDEHLHYIPRNLRPYFRRNRRLLGELPRLAWETVQEIHAACLPNRGAVPGMITVLQTFGELVHWNPHLHALVSDGAFATDSRFITLPEVAAEAFTLLWREKVFALLRKDGCINGRVVWIMRSWKHTGFSVDRSVRIHGADRAAVDRIVQYMVRCPFSLERFVRVTPDGKVFYRTENAECRPFAFEGRTEGKAPTIRRNFESRKSCATAVCGPKPLPAPRPPVRHLRTRRRSRWNSSMSPTARTIRTTPLPEAMVRTRHPPPRW